MGVVVSEDQVLPNAHDALNGGTILTRVGMSLWRSTLPESITIRRGARRRPASDASREPAYQMGTPGYMQGKFVMVVA